MRYFFGPMISDLFPTVTHRSKRFGPGSQLGELGTISVCVASHQSSSELNESLRQQCWAIYQRSQDDAGRNKQRNRATKVQLRFSLAESNVLPEQTWQLTERIFTV